MIIVFDPSDPRSVCDANALYWVQKALFPNMTSRYHKQPIELFVGDNSMVFPTEVVLMTLDNRVVEHINANPTLFKIVTVYTDSAPELDSRILSLLGIVTVVDRKQLYEERVLSGTAKLDGGIVRWTQTACYIPNNPSEAVQT